MLICALLSVSLCGCSRLYAQPQPRCRVVTGVAVTAQRGTERLDRVYRREEKILAVLQQLRLLKTTVPADCDPERLLGDVYEVTLHHRDGSRGVYRLRCGQYLSRDGGRWYKLAQPESGALFAVLRENSSDAEETTVANVAVVCYHESNQRRCFYEQ